MNHQKVTIAEVLTNPELLEPFIAAQESFILVSASKATGALSQREMMRGRLPWRDFIKPSKNMMGIGEISLSLPNGSFETVWWISIGGTNNIER